jgi:hypothetical protein
VQVAVVSVVFLGTHVRYQFRMGEGPLAVRLIAVTPSREEILVEGSVTQVGWHPDDIVTLDAGDARVQ